MVKNLPANSGDTEDVCLILRLRRCPGVGNGNTLQYSCLENPMNTHSSKASILRHSAFFMVQLSHLYMTIGKTIALTVRTFVGKVTSLLFNMLSRFVIAFLPRSKCLLILWLRSLSMVILEPPPK